MRGSLIIVGFFVIGIVVGFFHLIPQGLMMSNVSYITLCALIFLVGFMIGNDADILNKFRKLLLSHVIEFIGLRAHHAISRCRLRHRGATCQHRARNHHPSWCSTNGAMVWKTCTNLGGRSHNHGHHSSHPHQRLWQRPGNSVDISRICRRLQRAIPCNLILFNLKLKSYFLFISNPTITSLKLRLRNDKAFNVSLWLNPLSTCINASRRSVSKAIYNFLPSRWV